MDAFDSVYSNNLSSLKEYLETGDINCINERGMSLLHYAIIFNNSDIFDLLLENYINVNIKDRQGNTPAHYCVINNRMGFLKTLIRYGADLSIKNEDGHTPLFKSCVLGRENMISLFLESQMLNLFETDGKDETVFMALVRSRNLDLLNRVQVNDEIINRKNYIGETPLHIASKAGDLRVIQYLIDNHAFVNAKNKQNETPLFYAVTAQNKDVITMLLKAGAVLDCKSTFGDTIYHIIPTYELSSFINEKSEQFKNYLYHTNYPLHYAIIIENLELVKKYAEIRNLEHKDNFGYTPLQLAELINNQNILEILKENL